jgi:hypothetical protein
MIYCVVPEELAGELFDRLTDYYADDPNVTVIVDRRRRGSPSEDRPGPDPNGRRDRRRARVAGEFPPIAGE